MTVFAAPRGGYVWPDGSRRSIKPPSTQFGNVRTATGLIDGKPISFANIYRTQPWAAASVNLPVKQTASLPLQSFMPDGPSEDANRRRLRDHPLPRMLANPAPGRSGTDLKGDIQMGLKVQGNHLERIVRLKPGGEPVGLERIDWRMVQPLLSSDGMTVLAWSVTPMGGGAPEVLGPEDVIHFRWGGPDGPIGVSPFEQLGVTVKSEDAAQRYAQSSLRNGGMRGVGIVLSDKAAQDEAAREAVRQEVKHRHSGPDRAHEPFVFGGVERIESLPVQTAVEAELINQRKVNREEFAAVIGSPPVLIGDLTHATYSNVEAMGRLLYLMVLRPDLALIADQINAQLIANTPEWSSEGVWTEWSLDEVLKGDVVARMKAYKNGRDAGALTINDIRRMENHPPFTDPLADEPLIALNNTGTLSDLADSSGPSARDGSGSAGA